MKVTRESLIRSDALHAFLATPAGRYAQKHRLIPMLLDRVEYFVEPTVETFTRLVHALAPDCDVVPP